MTYFVTQHITYNITKCDPNKKWINNIVWMISSRFHTVLFEWNSGPISHKISWHTWPDIVHTVVTKVDTVWHGPIWPIRVHTGPKSVNRPWFLKTHSVSKSISPTAPTCSSPSIQASSPADEQSRDSIWFDLELTGSSWFWLHSMLSHWIYFHFRSGARNIPRSPKKKQRKESLGLKRTGTGLVTRFLLYTQ